MSTNTTTSIEAADLADTVYHCAQPHRDGHTWRVAESWPVGVYVTGTPQELYAAGCKLIALAIAQRPK